MQQLEIRYALADADGDSCMVWVSDDDGATWAVPDSQFTGDVGGGIVLPYTKNSASDCSVKGFAAIGRKKAVTVPLPSTPSMGQPFA